jgi:vitamin B12 transporter
MPRNAPAFAWLFVACAAFAAAGEDPPKSGPPVQYEIVVTATKLETPEREVASSITVITRQELLRTRRSSVLDALRDVVGLAVSQNGGPGSAASLFIRGANNEHTLILLDGVELNDPINPSRSYDLAHLSLNQVERVEVLRGPQSPLYGSDAMGGVINIITRRGRGRPRLSLQGAAGTYRTYNGDAALSGSSGRIDYALGLSYARTAGVSAADAADPGNSEKDGYRNLSLSGRFGYAIASNLDLALTVRSVRARTEIDDFGGPFGDDVNDLQNYGSTLARADLRGLFLGNRWEQRLSVSWIRSNRTLLNPPDEAHPLDSESGSYGSRSARLDWQNNVFLGASQTLTAGLEIGREEGWSDYASESAYGAYESSFPDEKARTAGFYVQDQWKVRGSFFLTAGARLDVHSRTGTALTYRIAPAYLIARTGTRLRATLGTGFKSPSLYQLYAPPTSWGPVGNMNLAPERVTGWDAGIDQDVLGDRLRIGLTYFRNTFRDLIDFDYALGYVNVGRARTSGAEISVESRPLGPAGPITLRSSYTRLSARDEVSGALLLRRPRDKFSTDLQARLLGRFDLAATFLYVGKRADRDFSASPYETIMLPGYVLLGGAVSASLRPGLDLYVRLDNVFDTRYETVWGYGTPGFTLTAGVRLAL